MGPMVLWHVLECKKWVMDIEDFVKQHVHTLSQFTKVKTIGCMTRVRACFVNMNGMKWNLDKNNVNIKDLYHESFTLSLHGKQRGIVHSCH
jgi:hypothetical protein